SYWSTSFRTPVLATQAPSQPQRTNHETISKNFKRTYDLGFFSAAAYCIPCDASQEAKIACNNCP
ncbi:MAG: hypothetical protein ACOYKA_04750, partial [Legionellaceae bacterium]